MEWKTLDSAPIGKTLVVAADGWDGVVTVHWHSDVAKDVDLSNWASPPTHWLDQIPDVPHEDGDNE